jgi:pimeloyl-ACP methyl ester carboxylesterase
MGRFRRVIHETVEVPVARDLAWKVDRRGYALYTGRYDSPNFQAGEYPYKTLAQGGGFEFDESGDPIVQSTDDLRFSMTIPTTSEMPEAGWPIVVYAHGTGGDYLSYEQNRTAERMAEQGIAVISIDQLMHGDRLDQGDVQTLFFNFQNPLSSRANVMQAALEDYQLVRLAQAFEMVERHVGGRTVRFDADKMFFFGHSQGSVTGVPFAAHEPAIKGAIFSGAGGLLYLTLLTKREPFDITSLVQLVIRDAEITKFHPGLAFLQAFYEPADAIVYARLLVQEPPEGLAPKNVFQPLGFEDNYTPRPTLEALATAFGLDLVAPLLEPIPGLELLEKRVLNAPVTNNAGEVTAIGAQFLPAQGSDGHFVSFDIEAARVQSVQFFKSLVDTGKATVVAP